MLYNYYFSTKYRNLKVSKEFKIGLVVVLSIVLLILGINYLKGSSFFGGDDVYYAYFPSSGGLMPSSSVSLNGVEIGKVLAVKLINPNVYTNPNKRVLIRFSVQTDGLKIAKGSGIKIVPGFLSTDVQLNQNFIADKGYFKVGDTLKGTVSQEVTEQIESQLLPVKKKLEDLMTSIDNIVSSITVFWDTSAAYTLDQGLNNVKVAIARFGNLAYTLNNFVQEETGKLDHIFTNLDSITTNFKITNKAIQSAAINVNELTDSLKSIDFKKAIDEATVTLSRLNEMFKKAANGEGTLGKLLHDEKLYNELNQTNKKLQHLVDDIKNHPERYIHFSVFGKKTKGVPLSKEEERKLKNLLDTLPE